MGNWGWVAKAILCGYLCLSSLGCVASGAELEPCTTSSECGALSCIDGFCQPWESLRSRPAGPRDGGQPTEPSDADVAADATQGAGLSETCGNGLDDDLDGEVEETCPCTGESQRCFTGDPALAGIGACAWGEQACDLSSEFGSFAACVGSVAPTEESCNGTDDDCDGTADEGCLCTAGETRDCYPGPEGTAGVGVCRLGTQACVLTGGAPSLAECVGATLPSVDVCGNGLDDDCDGAIDEGCACEAGAARACYEDATGTRGAGTPGVGVCREGSQLCEARSAGGSEFGPCTGAVFAGDEACDGIDNNCDGVTDEGCAPPVATDFCVAIPAGVSQSISIPYVAKITSADVLFLIDNTGSMGGEIANVQSRLTGTIIPGLAAEIPDITLSAAHFEDFAAGGYGSWGDVPFTMEQTSTTSTALVQAAIGRMVTHNGQDWPESHTEAMYQVATGAGLPGWIAPQTTCPAGRVGYPCFRRDATPIVILVSDATFHNGPGGSEPYWGIAGAHTYAQTVDALKAIGAKVLPLYSGADYGPPNDQRAIARDTGAVRADGTPLVFEIGSNGAGLDSSVIGAVRSLVNEAPIDIDAIVEDLGGGATGFVQTIAAESASPASGATNRGDRFDDVRPGTTVTFRVTFRNDTPATAASREYIANVVLRGNGVTRLSEATVRIIVPGTSGAARCP